jgi:hypothetical protein
VSPPPRYPWSPTWIGAMTSPSICGTEPIAWEGQVLCGCLSVIPHSSVMNARPEQDFRAA